MLLYIPLKEQFFKIWGILSFLFTLIIVTSFMLQNAFAQSSIVTNTFTQDELKWLEEHPTLSATNDMAWAPIDFVRAGKPVGYSVDYLNLIGEKLGVKIEFVNGYSWQDLITKVQNREIDIAHAIVKDSIKSDFLNYSAPYMDLPVVFFGPVGSQKINTLDDLNGKKIGIIAGSGISEEFKHNNDGLSFIEFDLAVDALTSLSDGKIDLFIAMLPTANFAINNNFIRGIEVVSNKLISELKSSVNIHLATHKDNTILSNILSKAISLITEREIINITAKWQANNLSNNNVNLTKEELNWISMHPILKATNEMDWAPIDFMRAGKPTGFSIDYLNLVANKVGIKIKYINGHSWQELVTMLENKEIDIAQSITQTSNRRNFLNFTSPYLDISKVYFGRKGAEKIVSMDDLIGKKIGIISSFSSQEIYDEKYPELNTIAYDDITSALNALSTGGIDVFSERLPIANYIISQNFISNLEVIGKEIIPEVKGGNYLRIASRNDWPLLLTILKKGMAAVTDQEFNQLSEKWRSEFYLNEDINLTKDELEWLSQNNVVKVVIDVNQAPYEFIDEKGNIKGIAAEYLDKISTKLNIRFEWAGNRNGTEAYEAFNSGDAPVVTNLIYTPERDEALHLTSPYMQSTSAIFTRKSGQFFGNMDGLNGHRIAQEKGFAMTDFIKRDYPNIEVIEVETVSEALKMVSTGAVNAYIGDIPTTAFHIATENLSQVVVAGDTPYKTNTVMGIHSDYPLLASAMEKAMISITETERAEIATKWLAVKFENNLNFDLIIKIVAGAAIILLIVLAWANSLRREIHRRHLVENQLKRAQMEAESANDAKSSFLANMSHEIRTPLNAIIGFSEIMTQNIFKEKIPPKYKDYLQDIEMSGRHLVTVINDILDLSKIEAQKWQLNETQFFLHSCIKGAFKMIETKAQEKQIRLFYSKPDEECEIEIHADLTAIKRTLINLLSNAVKFTPNGGSIKCHVSNKENGDLVIQVEDSGVGIPKDKLGHVLSPFGQNENTHITDEAGTGLGLTIVKSLMELHGGDFKLESEVNVGTIATITLPQSRIIHMPVAPEFVEEENHLKLYN